MIGVGQGLAILGRVMFLMTQRGMIMGRTLMRVAQVQSARFAMMVGGVLPYVSIMPVANVGHEAEREIGGTAAKCKKSTHRG